MTRRHRPRAAAVLALAGVLTLSGCTPPRAEAPRPDASTAASPAPTPERLATTTRGPAAPLTVVAEPTDVEASLRVSRELFDASPVVVVAPAGQAAAQEVAARASVELGVPLLVGAATTPDAGPGAVDPGLAAELDRLGARTVLAVGDVPGFPADDASGGPADDGDDPAGRADRLVLRAEATATDVAARTGLPVGAPAAPDPATFTAGIAALAAGTLVRGAPAGGDVDAAHLDVTRGTAPDGVVALALDGPEQLAPVATARAAGVPVHLAPAGAPNPQATGSVVQALHASAGARTLALGAAFGAEPALDWKIRSAQGGTQLPGGGQLLFPRHQFVALYGTPVTASLGVLGEQDAPAAVRRAQDQAAAYAGLTDRTVVPMLEIIATVAAGGPGPDGNYSNEQPVEVLQPWVEAAGAAGVQVVLDLQPGRSDFLTQARQYESLLRLPHVGLALDPEWRLGPDEEPLERIGSVHVDEVNAVARWLADLTNAGGLPPKMFVVHQFRLDMITDRARLDTGRPELAVVLHADGQGGQPAKQSTWRTLHTGAPAGVAWGWKNFLDEDRPVLTPEQTVRDVVPLPDLVTYQ